MSFYQKDGGPFHPQNDMTGRPMIPGITLRDWFASQAIEEAARAAAVVKSEDVNRLFDPNRSNITRCEIVAALAYEIADAMIAARSK